LRILLRKRAAGFEKNACESVTIWLTDKSGIQGYPWLHLNSLINTMREWQWYMCCKIMHIKDNFRNPRCTARIKYRAKQSDRSLKSCYIDYLLLNHGSRLTFVRGTVADHFFPGERSIQCAWLAWSRWSVMCTEEAYRQIYRGSNRTYQAAMCTRLCMAMHICRSTKSISVHAHAHTCTKRICR
jgi:hypothetical protein